MQNNRQVG